MLEGKGFIGGLYSVSTWIFRLMYLQILWFLFMIIGLVFLGFMPSTVAVFSIVRKWLMNQKEIPIFNTFVQIYRNSWKTSNQIGLILLIVGIFLYVDLEISYHLIKVAPLHFLLLIFCFVYIIVGIYIFPVFTHYDLKTFQYFKQAFLLAISQPLNTIALILWLLCAYILFITFPVIFLFMGIPIIVIPIMWFSFITFNRLEKNQIS